MREAVAVMKNAFAQLSQRQADLPLRVALRVARHSGVTLFMPAYLSGQDQMGIKIVSVFDENPARGLPLIHALVIVINPVTGEPVALMDGTHLTALRTGAASGAATDLLARPEARCVAILGAGVQGRSQMDAICAVRPVEEAWVYDVNRNQAEAFAAEMSDRLSIAVSVADDASIAVGNADVICTATTSHIPVFKDSDLRPGAHINAVGAYTPEMQEIPAETVQRAKIVVDHRTASMAEAGDLVIPLQQGLIRKTDIYAELGEIATGTFAGRLAQDEITLFKSVGIAVQDVAAASAVLEAAERLNLGIEIEL
jgi:alanine dehydrogenase